MTENSQADTQGGEDKQWQEVLKKFDEQGTLGDAAFLYQSWSAWALHPKVKRILPISRIMLGDKKGDVIFDRSVLLTGIADLVEELTNTFFREVEKASGMSGYTIEVGEPDLMLDDLKKVRDSEFQIY
jgi:hypothetical protein